MNNAQRARELLIAARKRIEKRHQTFICSALSYSAEQGLDDTRVVCSLQSWIADMLLPYNTYDNWVRHEHDNLMRNTPLWERNEKAREGRLAWIDWMLEQDLSRIVRKYNR